MYLKSERSEGSLTEQFKRKKKHKQETLIAVKMTMWEFWGISILTLKVQSLGFSQLPTHQIHNFGSSKTRGNVIKIWNEKPRNLKATYLFWADVLSYVLRVDVLSW